VKQALLLSGSLGAGHEVYARVFESSLAGRGWATDTIDAMALLGPQGGSAGEAVFRAMLATPGLYDAFHFAALRPGNRLALLADLAARRQVVPRLRDYLDSHHTDLAISVFATASSAVSVLAERYPAMSHVVLCSDVTPHRLWVQRNVDLYLVTSEAGAAAVRRYQPRAHVQVIPALVRAGFYDPPSRDRARAELGLPAGDRAVLLMSGAWGLGPLAEAAAALADAGVQVLAVAGRNARLEGRLRAAAQSRPRLRVFGYTEEIPALMSAADLVITSSGDTCSEARTIGRPLLLLDVVQGHGRDNLQHELELGAADVVSPRPRDVVRSALAALDRPAPPPNSVPKSPAAWETAFTTAMERIGLNLRSPRQGRGSTRRGRCLHGSHHDLVYVAALGVQHAQVVLELRGGGRLGGALGAQDGRDVVLYPLRVGKGPGHQAVDHPVQVKCGQRLLYLVRGEVVQRHAVRGGAVARSVGGHTDGRVHVVVGPGLDRVQHFERVPDPGRAGPDAGLHVGQEAVQVGGPL
jgi:processive 1,2-diacylglycerol beta-glucosyltransferase